MVVRLLIVTLLLGSAAYAAHMPRVEQPAQRRPFVVFPTHLEGWSGVDGPALDEAAVALLGVDEYLNRVYERGAAYLGLYIGYHNSQRQGDTLHSPLNCLPGSGWQPLSRTWHDIPVGTEGSIRVNRYVIQKGLERQVVLYWYQSHGRVIASEYAGKFYAVYDAIRLNRTDAAMIRIASPIHGSSPEDEQRATEHAVSFVRAIYPVLPAFIPS